MSKYTIPLSSKEPKYPLAPLAEKTSEKNISFSFLYFSQENNFGLKDVSSSWFLSVLERLKSLGNYSKSQILEDPRLKKTLRIHDINFNDSNVSIKRSSISSIPDEIRNNDADFPFYQISVSTSRGRIIGFFIDSTFFVVYFDKFHNMYPMEFGKTPTSNECSDYDKLLSKLRWIVNKMSKCDNAHCGVLSQIENIPGLEKNIVYIAVNDSDFDDLVKLGRMSPWEDILMGRMLERL